MNISKSFVLCFLSSVFVFAQQLPVDEKNAPLNPELSPQASVEAPVASPVEAVVTPPPPPPPPPSPVAEAVVETKPEVAESKTIFDKLRGNAYNPFSIVGAATTVGDLVSTPSYINGQKFFYVSPTSYLGYTAFPIGGSTALLGLDKSSLDSNSTAALILGYANSTFGVALNYSVAKTWADTTGTRNALDVKERVTKPGDNIGIYFSLPLGSATLYANAGWLTYSNSTNRESGDNEIKSDYSEIQGNLGLTGSLGSLSYDGYLNVIRTGGSMELNGDKYSDENAYLGTALHINVGYEALQNSYARIIVGANNYFSIRTLDKINSPEQKHDNVIGFVISPNILCEVSLTNSWLAFTGAKQAMNLISGDGDRNANTSKLTIAHSEGTDAFAGVRYQKTNWAVEAQILANVFNNPFDGFRGDNDVFAEFGGFVYF